MDKPCLTNKDEYPDDAVLARHLGNVKSTWDTFFAFLKEKYPLFSADWRYYDDGKSWLCKLTKKAKTVCWVSVFDNRFKTTFYFAERLQDFILKSQLEPAYKEQFVSGKAYGKIKGITVEIQHPSDLEVTKTLIELKEKTK